MFEGCLVKGILAGSMWVWLKTPRLALASQCTVAEHSAGYELEKEAQTGPSMSFGGHCGARLQDGTQRPDLSLSGVFALQKRVKMPPSSLFRLRHH